MTRATYAVCGLYCKACTVYIATREDPARLSMFAAKRGVSPEEMKCDGCRSSRRGAVCRSCEFVSCAEEHGVDFCGACNSYPCEKLENFNRGMPHRIEIWGDNERILAVGPEAWAKEKEARYRCRTCDTMNSAYDLVCRKCGNTPGNDYVAEHEGAIRAFWEGINNRGG